MHLCASCPIRSQEALGSLKGVAADNTLLAKSPGQTPGVILRNTINMSGKDKNKINEKNLVMEWRIPKNEANTIVAMVAGSEHVSEPMKQDNKHNVWLLKV